VAKLTGPCFSLKASGQLGKTLVYFGWKGLNALRTYVIPANPKSDAQTVQRNIFTAAITDWHASAFSAADVGAWNRYAGILAEIMSGFNAMVRTFIKEALLDNTWEKIWQVTTPLVQDENFDVIVHKAEGGNLPTIHWGKSKTNFPNSQAIGGDGVDTWRTTIADLTKNTLYYFYIDVGTSADDYGRTGIYSVRTLAD